MEIKFYVNGAPVETYKCADAKKLSEADEQAVAKIKQDVYRNFGYPPVLVVEAGE